MSSKRLTYIKRKTRTSFKLRSINNSRTRLLFYSSNKYIYSQIIKENSNITLTSSVTYDKEFSHLKNKNNIEAATELGVKVAKLLLEKNIKDIYFDRGGHKYHGKAKAFAESVRKNGLNF